MDSVTEMDQCTTETLEDIRAILRSVSVGIVLTPLLAEDVLRISAHGESLPLVFLRLPEHAIDVSERPTGEVDARLVFQQQSEVFYDVRDFAVMSQGGGVFDFTATCAWREWSGYLDRLAHREEMSLRFHVTNRGRATFVSLP